MSIQIENIRKIIFSFFLCLSLFFCVFIVTVLAATATFTGYSWSSNVGWISMSGTGYGVTIDDTTGGIEGYAWGGTGLGTGIGWIKFGGLSGCPSGGSCDSGVDLATGELVGWARACSATASGDCTGPLNPYGGGWDGWISLNCSNTGDCGNNNYKWELAGSNITGFAWGGDVIGWITANNIETNLLPPAVTFEVLNPDTGLWEPPATLTISTGEDVQFRWSSNNTFECLSSVSGHSSAGGWSTGNATAGTDSTIDEPSPGTSAEFTINCRGYGGTAAEAIAIQTGASMVDLEAFPVILDEGGSVTLTWDTMGNDPTVCTISGPNSFIRVLLAGEETGSETGITIDGESDFTLACLPNGFNPGASATVKARINSRQYES